MRRSIDPLETLANAIILQAVNDYRRLWIFKETDYAKKELIDFFRSEWFSILTKLDPDWLIERLEKEADAQREESNGETQALPQGCETLAKRGRFFI